MKTLELDSLTEMSTFEMIEIDGGFPPAVVAVGVAAGIGAAAVGVIIVGAAVGYGVYKLVDWATS